MTKVGKLNTLKVIKEVPFGVYLDGEHLGEILLPKKWVPKNTLIGDSVEVFIYFDSEDKIIATTLTPHAQLGEFAYMKVIDINPVGAFLDWGLDKDLLIPKPEQHRTLEKGKAYIVYLKQDNQERIIASSKIDYHLDKTQANYNKGQEVDLLLADSSDMGRKVIINNCHWGLIHSADIFQSLTYGQKMKGYIKTIREDGKIDVVVRKIGQSSIQDLAERIINELDKAGGFLPLHDKSDPIAIQRTFAESKKSFKSAIGNLYKQGKIDIESNGIRLRKP